MPERELVMRHQAHVRGSLPVPSLQVPAPVRRRAAMLFLTKEASLELQQAQGHLTLQSRDADLTVAHCG
jgi:hypothetical protein